MVYFAYYIDNVGNTQTQLIEPAFYIGNGNDEVNSVPQEFSDGEVFAIDGKPLGHVADRNELNALPKGIYLVRYSTSEGTHTKKLLVP